MVKLVFSEEQARTIQNCREICIEYENAIDSNRYEQEVTKSEKKQLEKLVAAVCDIYKEFNIPINKELSECQKCVGNLGENFVNNNYIISGIGFIIDTVSKSIDCLEKQAEAGSTDKCKEFRVSVQHPVEGNLPAGVRVSQNVRNKKSLGWTQGE